MARLLTKVLRVFAVAERPAAWCLMLGGAVTFFGVIVGFIKTGDAKWATLLIAADLVVSGFSAVQQAEEPSPSPESNGSAAGDDVADHADPSPH